MHRFKALIAFVAAALGGIAPALAGELTGTVNNLPSVSLSVGGSQPAASYTVMLKNMSSSSALNVARLVGTTTVAGGASGAKAEFKSVDGATCKITNADNTSVDCSVGSLAAGQETTFTITFIAPTTGTSIAFAWTAVFDNGTPPGISNGDAGTATIGLDPIDTAKVISDVPANVAVAFFTGGGSATGGDSWVTKVKVPKNAQATTAFVEEAVSDIAYAPNLTTLSTSTLKIPNSTFGTPGQRPLFDPTTLISPFLEITLLRDASTIAKGAKIDSATIFYRHDLSDADPFPLPKDIVPSCAESTIDAPLPRAGQPCEDRSQRYAYPSKSRPKDPPVPAGFEGDWKFVIYAVDNGRMAN